MTSMSSQSQQLSSWYARNSREPFNMESASQKSVHGGRSEQHCSSTSHRHSQSNVPLTRHSTRNSKNSLSQQRSSLVSVPTQSIEVSSDVEMIGISQLSDTFSNSGSYNDTCTPKALLGQPSISSASSSDRPTSFAQVNKHTHLLHPTKPFLTGISKKNQDLAWAPSTSNFNSSNKFFQRAPQPVNFGGVGGFSRFLSQNSRSASASHNSGSSFADRYKEGTASVSNMRAPCDPPKLVAHTYGANPIHIGSDYDGRSLSGSSSRDASSMVSQQQMMSSANSLVASVSQRFKTQTQYSHASSSKNSSGLSSSSTHSDLCAATSAILDRRNAEAKKVTKQLENQMQEMKEFQLNLETQQRSFHRRITTAEEVIDGRLVLIDKKIAASNDTLTQATTKAKEFATNVEAANETHEERIMDYDHRSKDLDKQARRADQMYVKVVGLFKDAEASVMKFKELAISSAASMTHKILPILKKPILEMVNTAVRDMSFPRQRNSTKATVVLQSPVGNSDGAIAKADLEFDTSLSTRERAIKRKDSSCMSQEEELTPSCEKIRSAKRLRTPSTIKKTATTGKSKKTVKKHQSKKIVARSPFKPLTVQNSVNKKNMSSIKMNALSASSCVSPLWDSRSKTSDDFMVLETMKTPVKTKSRCQEPPKRRTRGRFGSSSKRINLIDIMDDDFYSFGSQ
jgi:hypothetical protein